MRIDEAFRRVIGGYWWLISLVVIVALVGARWYGNHQPTQYEGVARVQMSGGLASTNVQADAATQWLQGVVTTPNMVRTAMAAAGLEGDPTSFAAHSIDVTRVGVSTVNDVSVTTGDRNRAIIAANSLVQQALKYANTSHQGDVARMDALGRQIDAVTNERDRLIKQLGVASPGAVLEIQARIGALAPTLTDLLRQRSDLVLSAQQRSSIGLLDPAVALPDPVGPKVPQIMALAGLAGLLLALGGVALLEAVHPRVRGRRWIAAELDAPLLGHLATLDLDSPDGVRSLRDFADAAAVVGRRFAGRPIMLLPVEKGHDRFAARICRDLERLTGVRLEHTTDAAVPPSRTGPASTSLTDPVVIVLSPSAASQRKLEDVIRTAAVMDWPIVGVLTFRRRLLAGKALAQGGRHVQTPVAAVAPTPPRTAPEPAKADRGALSSHKMRGMR